MRRIIAKFEGNCSICGRPIHPGMEIFWEKSSGAVHIACTDIPSSNSHDSTDVEGSREPEIEVPVLLLAREKYQDYQVRFYESLAVPEEILEAVSDETLSKDELTSYNQWRVDFPSDLGPPIDGQIRTVLVIAHKILTRGRITLVSPTLEKNLKQFFGVEEYNAESFGSGKYLYTCNRRKETDIWVDGPSEKQFLEEILFSALGPYYRHSVLPQVHISSLIPEIEGHDTYVGQRVDFLITSKDKRIIVELDGPDHLGHEDRDRSRDELLTRWGYEVVRIRNDELANGDGINLQDLRELLKGSEEFELNDLSTADKYVIAVKLAHQLQIVVIEALLSGALNFSNCNNIYLDTVSINLSGDQFSFILNEAVVDLCELIRRLAKLYKYGLPEGKLLNAESYANSLKTSGIVVSYGENVSSSLPCFFLQDITFPLPIAQFSRSASPTIIEKAPKEELAFFLKYIFRKEDFWEGQYETISRALAGRDVIVLLPTGAGKSIAFQLASMLLPGVALVVDPIISLIEDQIDNLQRVGIDRAIGISSQIEDPTTKSRVIRAFGQGEYLFCYVAPERFQSKEFRASLRSLTLSTPVSLITIDEAHCVSEWGHDFRPSYLNIGRTTREHCTSHNRTPPLLALTGTASYAVLKDVQRELQIQDFDSIVTPKTFDRQELRYSIYEAPSDQKQSQLQSLLLRTLPEKFATTSTGFYRLREDRTLSGLVFCLFIEGDFGVVNNTQALRQVGIHTEFYCGGIPKSLSRFRSLGGKSWNQYKRETAKSFKNNKCPLLVATKAFGMGIDKPNIRYTIHFGIPPSIEAFYQEAGRAGRNRERAECVLLFSVFDRQRVERLLHPDTPIENIIKEREAARKDRADDDITRALFFHTEAFIGIKEELVVIDIIMKRLGDLREKRRVTTVLDDEDTKVWEKAIHRLIVLGVIEDYTIEYANREFTITIRGIDKEDIIRRYELYVSGYNKRRVKEESQKLQQHLHMSYHDFVKEACRTLTHFIYDTIEKGRRRALREMFLLADRAVSEQNCDQIVRSGILRYLESSRAEEIEAIVNDEHIFDRLKPVIQGYETPEGEVIGGIRSPRDAADMRGQVSRYLESVPDHPGLLFLRAVSEAYCADFKLGVIFENLHAGVSSALNRYLIDKEIVYEILAWLITDMSEKRKEICPNLIEDLVYYIDDFVFARLIISKGNLTAEDMLYPAGIYLFNNLAKKAVKILEKS